MPYAFFITKEVNMNKLNKLATIITSALLMLSAALPLSASEPVNIRLNGRDTEIGALLIGTTTYVPFDSANDALSYGTAEISGNASEMSSVSPFASIKATEDDCYIEAEGRYFGGSNSVVISGMLYVPVRSLAKAYGAEVSWDDSTRSVDLYSEKSEVITHGDSYYRADEVYWLSRIIHAESNGEPMNGKIMVGNVILNRVASDEFPNTIYSVIFDTEHGVQFTPTANGTIYNTPDEESIIAAKICLDSYYISRTAMYFLNPALATSFWVPNNRPYLTTIGSHDFYA